MAKSVASEVARAKKSGARVLTGFSGAMRSVNIDYLQDGDVILFPENYEVLSSPIRGSKNEETGKPNEAEYIYVEVERGGKTVPVPFYPSSFWKRRAVCDDSGFLTGDYETAGGDVLEDLEQFATIDESVAYLAAQAKAGRKVKVTMKKIKTLRFGAEEGSKPQNANLPQFNWA